MYDAAENDDFDREEVATYEEVRARPHKSDAIGTASWVIDVL